MVDRRATTSGEAIVTLDELAQLWAEDRSVAAISAALNTTKGKVIGAVWRARKAGDERFAPRPKAAKARKLKPPGETIGNSRPLPPPPAPPRPRTIEWLSADECRWPVGLTSTGQ